MYLSGDKPVVAIMPTTKKTVQRSTVTLHLDSNTKTMKKLLLISTAVLGLTVAYSQTTFQKTYGGTNDNYLNSVDNTSDGGYIIAGYEDYSATTYINTHLLKMDSNDNLIWSKKYGYSNQNLITKSIKQTTDGGFIIAGGAGGSGDMRLMKTDSNGNILWSKRYSHSPMITGLNSVEQTQDGGFILAGYISPTASQMDYDACLIRTDSNGDTLWVRKPNLAGVYDEPFATAETDDGGFMVVGTRGNLSSHGVFLFRVNSNGSLVWMKTMAASGDDFGQDIIKTMDGSFAITGYAYFNNDGLILFKCDTLGAISWAKRLGQTDERGYALKQSPDSGFIITGQRSAVTSVFLLKANKTGNPLWAYSFAPGSGYSNTKAKDILITNDGRYLIAAETYNTSSALRKGYIIKTDSSGLSTCFTAPVSIITTTITPTSSILIGQLISAGATISTTPITSFTPETIGNLCATGLNNLVDETEITILPNPFSTQTVLQTDNPLNNATLTVDNIFGQTVAQIKNISGQTVVFSSDNLASGLYFVRLTEENKTIAVDKLVITDK